MRDVQIATLIIPKRAHLYVWIFFSSPFDMRIFLFNALFFKLKKHTRVQISFEILVVFEKFFEAKFVNKIRN